MEHHLDHRIVFLKPEIFDDGYSDIEKWSEYGRLVYASKKDIRDGERISAAQVSSFVTTRFVVRSSSFTRCVTTQHRIKENNNLYEITAIKELGRNAFIEITANMIGNGQV